MNDDRSRGGRHHRDARERGRDEQPSEAAGAEEDLPVDVGPAAEAEPVTSGEDVDYRDKWLRTEADLQNYRRRAQRDAEEGRRAAEDRLLRDVIDVLDDLDRAIGAAQETGAEEKWLAGVQLVASKLREMLTRYGVTPIEALGRPFDPHEQEALLEVDAPEGRAPGEVASVVRTGYRRGDRVLRPARVAVARARVESR
jgi:molecular chaperone GrpE